LPGRRAKRDFAETIEKFYSKKTVMQKARDDKSCDSFATGMKDLSDYAEKNFEDEHLINQHLKIAYSLCSECKRTQANNCGEVFRRLGLAKDYLVA
jgi:hypothetical protein